QAVRTVEGGEGYDADGLARPVVTGRLQRVQPVVAGDLRGREGRRRGAVRARGMRLQAGGVAEANHALDAASEIGRQRDSGVVAVDGSVMGAEIDDLGSERLLEVERCATNANQAAAGRALWMES